MTAAVVDRRTIRTARLGPIPAPRATTEDPIVSAGPSLSPKQFASLKQARAEINVWTGAVRSGKTVSSLLRWMMYVRRAPLGGRLVMIGRTKDTLNRNVFSVLQDPMIFGPLAAEVKYTPGANVAYIFGRVIDVIGANDVQAEAKLRGLTCAGAYVDEITLLPKDFWTQLLARKSIDAAKLFGTTNPDNPAHWLRHDYLLRADDPALGLRHWHFTLDDNPALSARRKAAYRAQFTGLFYKRFVLGHWVAAEGAIFDMWDEDRHVLRGQMPLIERWLSVGIDYGTSNPFAAVSIGMSAEQRPRLVVASEYRYNSKQAHRSKSDQEYSDDVQAWLARHPIPGTRERGINPEYVVVDPSAASFIVVLRQAGLVPAAGDNSVLDGIRGIASLLHLGRLVVHESCTALIAEFPGYSWDDKEAQRGRDVPIKADDHSLDALRYGTHTTRALWRPFLLEYA